MEKYWRIGRSDIDVFEFLSFLKTEYKYVELKKGIILPSRVTYVGSTPNDTIIATIDDVFGGNIANTLSEGILNDKRMKITWEEDNERRIINFDLKYVRKVKLDKIEKSNN